jgi:peptidoglycan/xylan/chitin deacetylase (PgdA/CDA1 family)
VFFGSNQPASAAPPAGTAPAASGVLWTFDDCEAFRGQGTVNRYIQNLHAYGIGRAIFFMTGDCFRSRPDLVATIRQSGFEIGNHTAHHRNLVLLAPAAVDAEVSGGPPGARYFRPPYGAHNATVDSIVARHGLTVMMWTVDSGDTAPVTRLSCNAILARLGLGVRPGSIVLMHMHNAYSPSAMAAFLAGRAGC